MKSYRIQKSRAVYEVLKTEVIVIDFQTGNYYALIHVAKAVWQLIEQQTPLQRIAQLVAERYQCEFDKVLSDLHFFIGQLLEDGLIELTSDPALTEAVDFPEGVYDAPRVQKYIDVQNLLLLDPIHEVTEVGWPDKLV